MKLLFDQNLSHRLPARLVDLFPDSSHVRTLGLDRSPDDEVWRQAKTHGFAIVSQDADFAERGQIFGAPPKVIWLRCGNTTPATIEQLLRKAAPLITAFGAEPKQRVLELLP